MKKTLIKIGLITLCYCFSISATAQKEPYKDVTLSFDKRAEDLVKRLTLEEKVRLMMDESKAVDRLGLKKYNWWNEALHGVARTGLATVFPQAIGMAASFDDEAVFNVFTAVSDEARAKHTQYASKGSYEQYQGLTMWTPNINIFRDPHWGRGMETYGEDPHLTSKMGLAVVKGLQGPEGEKYDKLHACAKHFAVHSGPEWNRHSFDAKDIKARDLYETYLPAFEVLVKEGNVKEVMCAYNRFEGDPCCGSNQLLVQILRERWGFDGVIVADCGAISDFYRENAHKTHPDAPSASAAAVLSGTDLDCGRSYKALVESVEQGHINENDIDVSVKRLLKARFELGEMDNLNDVSWSKIPYSVVASQKHDSISLDITRRSMTLLLNKENILPLKTDNITIAVMGPNANDSVMQWANYNGIPPHTVTILNGIQSALGSNSKLIYERGCGLVERTLLESVFNDCISDKGQGFSAKYWNNSDRKGNTDVERLINTPFSFCTSGATVFAPGVNLTGFSATYNSRFTPKKSGEVVFDLYANGLVNILINGNLVKKFRADHGSQIMRYTMKVEAAKAYDIQIDFAQFKGDAQLNFDLGYKAEVDINKAVASVKDADVVIFAGGISPSLEGEEMGVNLPGFRGGDRTDIELPAIQRELIQALKDAGKKVILVNCSGSAIGLEPEASNCQAILQAWYPGQSGGTAVADVLFGKYSPAGRLPVTFYKNSAQIPDFEDYNMTGRTYRYMIEEPLFPFGYGLSYATFIYETPLVSKSVAKVNETIKVTIPISNNSKFDSDEVVQLYIKKEGDTEGPNKALRAYKRIHIPAGKTINITFTLTEKDFEWWDENTQTMNTSAGTYKILVGSSSKTQDLKETTIELR